MSEQRRPVPGTWLVIAAVASAVAGAAALRPGRVAAPLDGPPPAAAPWPDMRLDVNRATAAELNALPGLGPALAERIAADRAAAGPFASVDDLARVPGIGPAKIERVRPLVVAEP